MSLDRPVQRLIDFPQQRERYVFSYVHKPKVLSSLALALREMCHFLDMDR